MFQIALLVQPYPLTAFVGPSCFQCEKNRKNQKTGVSSISTGWVGGLAVAGGEVRRGKPSQTGDLTIIVSEPRQHPVGVRRIEDASARPPHPKMAGPADGVAQSVLGVYAGFLAKSSSIF